jgi:hypothetical protein
MHYDYEYLNSSAGYANCTTQLQAADHHLLPALYLPGCSVQIHQVHLQ